MLFGSSEFSREYGKRLGCLSGAELTAELRQTIETMSGADQRTRDRGSYLILENLDRTPEEDREGLLRTMFEANPNPSHGVRSRFDWKPTKMPDSSATTFAIVRAMGADYLIERVRNIQAKGFALAKRAALLIDDALELRKREAGAAGSITGMQLESRRKKSVRDAIRLSIKYKMSSRLAQMCDTGLLNLKGDEYISAKDIFSIGTLLEDEVWLTAGIERAIDLMAGVGLESDWYALAERAFELVREDRFASYRQKLFSATYSGRIIPRVHDYYDASYLKLLAQMAVHFQNVGWQNQVYVAAMRQMPDKTFAYEAYDAFPILAPVHEKSREAMEKIPRPAFKFVLR